MKINPQMKISHWNLPFLLLLPSTVSTSLPCLSHSFVQCSKSLHCSPSDKPTNGKLSTLEEMCSRLNHISPLFKKKNLWSFSGHVLDLWRWDSACSLRWAFLKRRWGDSLVNILNEIKMKKQTAGLRWQWNKMAAGSSAFGNTVVTMIHSTLHVGWVTARQTLRWLMIMAEWWLEGGHSQWMFTAKMLIS